MAMERSETEKAEAVIGNLQQMIIFADSKLAKAKRSNGDWGVWYAQTEALKMAINVVKSEFNILQQ